jgi:hypothetical protein
MKTSKTNITTQTLKKMCNTDSTKKMGVNPGDRNVDLDLNLRQVCEYMRRALTKHIDDAIPIHFDIPDYNQH